MADRFFPNVMPNFVAETPASVAEQRPDTDSFLKLLSMPYLPLSEHFKRAALDLKENVLLSLYIYVYILYEFGYDFSQ